MKKVMIALFLFAGTAITPAAKAQVNVQVNIGSQPAWGPTGYDHADFYYLPEINCYYDIARAQFIYLQGNNWVYGNSLPGRYHNPNLYNMYKVVVNQPTPYRYNQTHINEYARYKTVHNQQVIRDSHDARYTQNRHDNGRPHNNEQHNHPDHR